jgi:hypothetical protein
MFPIKELRNKLMLVGHRETIVAPTNFYLAEIPLHLFDDATFRFWKGCQILKVFKGEIVEGGRVMTDGSIIHEFVGDDWPKAKAELEAFFDQWMERWFRRGVAGDGDEERRGIEESSQVS